MRQRWERLTFLHWSYDPARGPAAAAGRAAGGSVRRAGLGRAGAVLHAGAYRPAAAGRPGCPTSARRTCAPTYGTRPGSPGSGSCPWTRPAAGAVAVARASYGLPYFWSSMGLSRDGRDVSYHCRRRVPGPRGAVSEVRIRIGEPYEPGRARRPGPLPHRPVAAVQRVRRPAAVGPGRAPALAAVPGRGPRGHGRAHPRGRPAGACRGSPGALLTRRRCPDRPAGAGWLSPPPSRPARSRN